MKVKYFGIFWGVILVLVGGWFLVTKRIAIMINDPYLGMVLAGGLSLLFLASYYISGTKRWGWLFPASIFAGTVLVILLSLIPGLAGGVIAAPVLLSVAVPFLVAYLQEPKTRRWALIPIYALAALTVIVSITEHIPGEFVGTLVLLAVALPFLVVYLTRRRAQGGADPLRRSDEK